MCVEPFPGEAKENKLNYLVLLQLAVSYDELLFNDFVPTTRSSYNDPFDEFHGYKMGNTNIRGCNFNITLR